MGASFRNLMIAAAVCSLAAANSATAVELTYGSWPPASDHLNTTALPNAFKTIEEQTKGAVKWKLVPGGQLAGAKESFQAVQDGVIQGALAIAIYVPNLVPSLNTIYSTIVFSRDVVAATGAAMETVMLNCPSCTEEFQKFNAVMMGGFTGAPYAIYCREPVKTVDDLKGKRIRGTGGGAELWKIAGAVPIGAALPEAVSLLQRGGMDCMWGTWEWLKTFGYGDFAKHVGDLPLGISGPAVGMMLNRDAWKSLTPDQRRLHLKQAGYVSAEMALGNFVIKNENTFKEVQQTKGIQIVKMDEKGFDELIKKYKAVERERNIENAKKFGVKDPAAIIDAHAKNLQKWEKLSPDIGRDIKKFTDALNREIYDKVDPEKL
jgi:TRAP-type C4-dicarboxylate transport system substrate-binding protein